MWAKKRLILGDFIGCRVVLALLILCLAYFHIAESEINIQEGKTYFDKEVIEILLIVTLFNNDNDKADKENI